MPQTTEETRKLLEPVRFISGDDESKQPRPGVALCLSGGGYRAMVFHLGTLIRLNELGQLRKLARVSSVSGGSITAGVLGLNWKKLKFNADDQAENLMDMVIRPLMDFAPGKHGVQICFNYLLNAGINILGRAKWRGGLHGRMIAHARTGERGSR